MVLDSGFKSVDMASQRSFEGCPYKCSNGYIINPYLHTRQECPHCSELRRKMVAGTVIPDKDVHDVLNLPRSLTGGRYSIDLLWPEKELKLFTHDSVQTVDKFLTDLMQRATGVVSIKNSVVINLGKHAHTLAFAYPFMLQAYKGSKSVAPYVSDYDVRRLFSEKPSTIEGLELDTLLTSDICLVNILASATLDSILACKGLMQLRARFDKATLFLTDYYGPWLQTMYSDGESMDLAVLISVEYQRQDSSEVVASPDELPEPGRPPEEDVTTYDIGIPSPPPRDPIRGSTVETGKPIGNMKGMSLSAFNRLIS